MSWTSEAILTAVGAFGGGECVTEVRMAELTGLTERQIKEACVKLVRHNLLEKTARGCHKLTAAGKEALASGKHMRSGPKKSWESGHRVVPDTLRDRSWRAMRIRRKFTVPELISLVVDGTERGDVSNNLQKYLKALQMAGYLVLLPRREPGLSPKSPGYKRWWLRDEKDTGPKAPLWKVKAQKVYDPNTEETHDISGVAK